MSEKYTVDYFINKFEAIPENLLLETIDLIKSEFSAKINQQKRKDELSKLKNPTTIKEFHSHNYRTTKGS